MESKLNLIAVQDYSDELARIFIKEIDPTKDFFSGRDILNLNHVKQVNFFILKDIFFGWQAQAEKIKNPYFDFENAEVKLKLKDLMNSLSHHIKIQRKGLEKLYSSAINDTILFYLVPDFYLHRLIQDLDENFLKLDTFKQLSTYIDLNKNMYEQFLSKLEEDKTRLENKKALFDVISALVYEAEEKDIFDYFSSKKTLDVEQFLKIEDSKEELKDSTKLNLSEGKRFEFDNEKLVHEKFKKDEPTLNDKMKDANSTSLVDKMQKQKIGSISKSISLNQRFVFIKELFEGNLDNYETALNSLDALTNWQDANQFIEEKLAQKHNWDISKDSVAEFTRIVERRFN